MKKYLSCLIVVAITAIFTSTGAHTNVLSKTSPVVALQSTPAIKTTNIASSTQTPVKNVPAPSTAPKSDPAPAATPAPVVPAVATCADETTKYEWNKSVAYNVMMVESQNRSNNLNDNPATGDYSVGCFQINLYGSNLTAKYRTAVAVGYTGEPTREALVPWLWVASNNVKVAHAMWAASGWSPWQATTCKKVACY